MNSTPIRVTVLLSGLLVIGCADSSSAASRQDTEAVSDTEQSAAADKSPHTNLLINETSPYLLQHAHNPVYWHPWGPAAFAKAKEQNKPIFLSVGYSTCYWCHVMERESFEREEVAAVLNEHFIAIKVDREERPDVDEQFMLATQIVTGRGGWPNSVWLTPEGEPWMAGTYFPRDNFISVLQQLADVWKSKRTQVDQQAERLTAAIHRAGTSAVGQTGKPLSAQLVQQAASEILKTADNEHGGFGTSPKFPPHGNLRLLSQESVRSANSESLPVIVSTLDAMLAGGVRDHIGGGFHRYSTDDHWLLPHFEKMLYDNAQLMRAYTDGFRLTKDVRYRDVVNEIFVWLQREMTSSDGAFYSAIDSESEHEEGRFYIWTVDEVIQLLGEADGQLFADVYGFQADGNFTEEATGKKPGTNIPHLPQTIAEFAAENEHDSHALTEKLVVLRATLLQERNERVFPHLDDKVLTAWNGLMIESLAYAGGSLNEPRYVEAAGKAAEFILKDMTRDGRLLRTHRTGQSKQPAFLNDYAFFTGALIELHAATDDEHWLTEARALADIMLTDFEDSEQGGFYFATANSSDILSRSRNLYGGGNLPSGNAVAAQALLRLDALESTPAYRKAAQRTLEGLSGLMWQSPASSVSLVAAVDLGLRTGAITDIATNTEPAADRFTNAPIAGVIRASTDVVRPGQSLDVSVELTIDEGWHLYGTNPDADFLVPSTVTLNESASASVVSSKTTAGKQERDPVIDQDVVVFEGNVVFTLTIQVANDARPGDTELTFNVRTQACDEQRCLEPRDHELSLTVNVAAP